MKHIIITSPTGHKVDLLGAQGGGGKSYGY